MGGADKLPRQAFAKWWKYYTPSNGARIQVNSPMRQNLGIQKMVVNAPMTAYRKYTRNFPTVAPAAA
eukprot:CAMPEP_0181329238 /NCGR_PEP_ID=MMETSP1101-20121128/23195_1 /TAXON_ID=46948 /ORGANISM="Rhodomonas abbreviata, Strain Caron Lab Isolate" /LENGTH=66 /DNA_ID=CAMNT_0023438285 /DNA_START=116 /DNA_END=313 /DNA_ORIENTATION=+